MNSAEIKEQYFLLKTLLISLGASFTDIFLCSGLKKQAVERKTA